MDNLIDIVLDTSSTPCSTSNYNKIKHFEGSYNEFFHQFLATNEPCIIRNVTQSWASVQLWVTDDGKPNIDYLKSRYGNAEVTVANCNQKYYNAQLKTNLQFSEFADYWKNLMKNEHPSSEPCLYLKVFHTGLDWHFPQDFPDENVYTVPREFSNDWLNEYCTSSVDQKDDYRFVYMGPKRSWTPFHADVFLSYSWSVNVCGEKKWILLPPGEEEKLKDKFGNLPYDISFLEEPNNNVSDVTYMTIIQKAGEAIFVPSGWHHQVWNLLDTISINHNWINASNIDKMWSSMLKNLEDVKKEIIEFRNTMEDWENHCQMLLKTCFGMDFCGFYDFLCYILEKRKSCITAKNNRMVFGKWVIGQCYLEYDLKKVGEVLDVFLDHADVKLCLENNNV